MWTKRPEGAKYGHKGIQSYVTKKYGIDVAGNIMIARTNPPQRPRHQQPAVVGAEIEGGHVLVGGRERQLELVRDVQRPVEEVGVAGRLAVHLHLVETGFEHTRHLRRIVEDHLVAGRGAVATVPEGPALVTVTVRPSRVVIET